MDGWLAIAGIWLGFGLICWCRRLDHAALVLIGFFAFNATGAVALLSSTMLCR